MKVSDVMSHSVHLAKPDDTLKDAAAVMAKLDAGILPVAENDRLIGMVTDRDIAVKGVAQGMGPANRVRDVMTEDVKYCFEDQDIEDVTRYMADIQVRRLPVLNKQKRLVGIISLGDIAISRNGNNSVGEALQGISRTGGLHNQSVH